MKKAIPMITGDNIYELLTLETIRHKQIRNLNETEKMRIEHLADMDLGMYNIILDYVQTWM